MPTAAEILGNEGLLARHIKGFAAREQQQEMATAISAAIESAQALITEAGTGTGKTFAYLVPALISGQRVIISTGTKNLQDQLYHRDLPVVHAALQSPVTTALLKGRSNYLCRYRLRLTEQEGRLASRELVHQLSVVCDWAGKTELGDIAEVTTLSEASPLWPLVTSTVDNCLGTDCTDYAECHVMKARKEAQEADLLVINHHLLFADMALREEGFGELLPDADVYIIDEAHQLPETASAFLGESLSARQLNELASDTVSEYHRDAGDMRELAEKAERLEYAVRDMRLALGVGARRMAWQEVCNQPKVVVALKVIGDVLVELEALLEIAAPRGKGLESCLARCQALKARLALFSTADLSAEQGANVYWLETYTRSFVLNATPLDIADAFHQRMQAQTSSWIFTSATLAVGERFDHFAKQLGLQQTQTARWESPFDYEHNAMLYLPEALPEPNSSEHTQAVVEAALPVLADSRCDLATVQPPGA